jgi:hypothetical protein
MQNLAYGFAPNSGYTERSWGNARAQRGPHLTAPLGVANRNNVATTKFENMSGFPTPTKVKHPKQHNWM